MARVAIPIRRINLINGKIKEYPSISQAVRENDAENICIRRALYGKWTHYRGYRWEMINEECFREEEQMAFGKKYQITAGPLNGIKGELIDYSEKIGFVEIAIGSEVSTIIHKRFLKEV